MKLEVLVQTRNALTCYFKVNQVQQTYAFQNLENQTCLFSLCTPSNSSLAQTELEDGICMLYSVIVNETINDHILL